MITYSVYEKDSSNPVAIKQGWSWTAFFFPFLWALHKGIGHFTRADLAVIVVFSVGLTIMLLGIGVEKSLIPAVAYASLFLWFRRKPVYLETLHLIAWSMAAAGSVLDLLSYSDDQVVSGLSFLARIGLSYYLGAHGNAQVGIALSEKGFALVKTVQADCPQKAIFYYQNIDKSYPDALDQSVGSSPVN